MFFLKAMKLTKWISPHWPLEPFSLSIFWSSHLKIDHAVIQDPCSLEKHESDSLVDTIDGPVTRGDHTQKGPPTQQWLLWFALLSLCFLSLRYLESFLLPGYFKASTGNPFKPFHPYCVVLNLCVITISLRVVSEIILHPCF